MKVRPSVKPMCDKCKVIRRHGNVQVICTNPGTSSARAERGPMARISGVDIPREKRVVIALTYIYGIGPTRAAQICASRRTSTSRRASAT